jgi:cytochrome b561
MATAKYPLIWRLLHWVIAIMVLAMLPIGFWMADRGEAGLWGALTGTLYASHKTVGFLVLWLMVVRLVFRLTITPPSYPPQMPAFIRRLAHSTHHLMYVLLFAIALLGWAGVTAFPALSIAGGWSLPSMPFIPESRTLSKLLFTIHGWLAIVLSILVVVHIAGALKHKFIDKDGVFDRMSLKK